MSDHESTKKSKSKKPEEEKDRKKKEEEKEEEEGKEKKCPPQKNKPLLIAGGIAIGILILIGAYFIFSYIYQDKVYPGLKLGENIVGGMTEKEVETLIDSYNKTLSEDGIDFVYEDTTYNLKPDVFSVENPMML